MVHPLDTVPNGIVSSGRVSGLVEEKSGEEVRVRVRVDDWSDRDVGVWMCRERWDLSGRVNFLFLFLPMFRNRWECRMKVGREHR